MWLGFIVLTSAMKQLVFPTKSIAILATLKNTLATAGSTFLPSQVVASTNHFSPPSLSA